MALSLLGAATSLRILTAEVSVTIAPLRQTWHLPTDRVEQELSRRNEASAKNTMPDENILSAIPHREPFLWIDDVVHADEQSLTARKFLDPALPLFAGHFPGRPIFPGVLQCEAALQAGAILISRLAEIPAGHVPVATRMNDVKFRRIVKPGETIEIEVRLTERLANAFFLTGKVSVDGQVATRLEFACSTAPAD